MLRSTRWLIAVIGILFLLHFVVGSYLAHHHPDLFLQNDGNEYFELGKNLGERGEFVMDSRHYYGPRTTAPMPEAYRVQIQSVLQAGLIRCGFSPENAAALFLAFAAAASSLLMFLLAEKLSGGSELAGWLALGLFQIHPLLALYSVQFGSEAAFTASLLLLFYCLTLSGWKRIGWGAFAGALASLFRPTALIFLPAGVCLILLLEWTEHRRFLLLSFEKAATYAVLFTVLLLPVGFRNLHQTGTFNFSGCLGGFNLYVGNNRHNMEAYSAHSGTDFIKHQTLGWNGALAIADALPIDMPPKEADRFFAQKAWEDIRNMSGAELLRLFAGKAWHFLRPYPMPDIHGRLSFWAMTLADSLLLLFGIAGLVMLAKRQYVFFWTALMIVGSGFAAHTLVHVYMRHRVPFMIPVLCLFSACVLQQIFARLSARKQHGNVLKSDLC